MVMPVIPIFMVNAEVKVLYTDEIISMFGGITL
jgi:hypothetical protein